MSTFNINGNVVKVGDVADIYPKTGAGGYAPVSGDVPTPYNFINYKDEINSKAVTSAGDVQLFTNGYFDSEGDMLAAIEECATFFNNIVWVFGGAYGGVALGKVDSTHLNMYIFYGVEYDSNGKLHPIFSSNGGLTYSITIDNTNIVQLQQQKVGSKIEGMQSPTTVSSGFIVCKFNDFGDSNIIYKDSYGIIINPQCTQGWVDDPVTPSPTYGGISWNSSVDTFSYNYLNKYTTVLPDIISTVILDTFRSKRIQQFKLLYAPFIMKYENYSMWNNTNLFSGVPNDSDSPTGQATSTSAGGYPNNNFYSEKIPEPTVPTTDLINTGFVRLYNPTKGEVQSFANFLFSSITDSAVNTIKKILVNPLDGIMSLHMIHTTIPTEASMDINFCGVSSGVSASVVSSQYKSFKYAININELYNSFVDYSNFTKMRIYIPYCGTYELNPDEFVEGRLILKYNIDIISGMCVAVVMVEKKQKNGVWIEAPLYVYNGNCILTMPLSASDWRNTFLSVIDIAGNALIPTPTGAANIANDIFSQKVTTQKSGSLSANFGYLSNQQPYVIVEHPAPSYPKDYTYWKGYPSNIYTNLKNIRFANNEDGMLLKVAKGDLWTSSINATEEEKEELKNLFDEGVWLRKVQ